MKVVTLSCLLMRLLVSAFDCMSRRTDISLKINITLLEMNLQPASVVTVYLLGSATRRLRPKLEKELAAGARVVSHDFKITPWTPIKTETIEGGGRQHTIYVYEIGKH